MVRNFAYYVIADNPRGDSCYYAMVPGKVADYYAGEE
jgi:hypothetical protein